MGIDGRRALRLVGWAASLASLFFVANVLRAHTGVLARLLASPRGALATAGAAVLIAAAHATTGAGWSLVLRALGAPVGLGEACAINLRVQLAKYIPGNLAHHVGRALLARERGVPTATAGLSLVTEGALMVAGAVSIGIAMGCAAPDVRRTIEALLPRAAVFFPVAFAVLGAVAALSSRAGRRGAASLVARLHRRSDLGAAFAAYLAVFLWFGLAFALVSRTGLDVHGIPFATGLGLFALSWAAGSITPGAPAGLGVREAALLLTLRPLVGDDSAVAISAAMRAAGLLADVLSSAAGACVQSRRPRAREERGRSED